MVDIFIAALFVVLYYYDTTRSKNSQIIQLVQVRSELQELVVDLDSIAVGHSGDIVDYCLCVYLL